VNVIAIVTVAIAYGATATAVTSLQIFGICDEFDNRISEQWDGPSYGIDVSGWPLLMLGIALLIQTCISIWILVLVITMRPKAIKTWSSDPVINAIYIFLWAKPEIAADNTRAEINGARKQTAHQQVPRLCWLVRVMWAAFVLMLVTVSCAAYFAKGAGRLNPKNIVGDDVWLDFGYISAKVGKNADTTDWAGTFECRHVQFF
jgi:hypothetical protein